MASTQPSSPFTKAVPPKRYAVEGGRWSDGQDVLAPRCGPQGAPLMAVYPAGNRANPLLQFECPPRLDGVELRLSVAVEDRHPVTVQVARADGKVLPLNVKADYPDPFQVLRIPLQGVSPADMEAGLRLQLTGTDSPLWLFAPGTGDLPPDDPRTALVDRDQTAGEEAAGLAVHAPHLLAPVKRRKTDEPAFLPLLVSLASLQTMSWKEGCVLEGLLELHDRLQYPGTLEMAKTHLDVFGFSSGELVYEDPRALRRTNELTTIEGGLPFIAVSRFRPDHPWVELFLSFCHSRREKNGAVVDGEAITGEGAYTISYPLAALAQGTGQTEWRDEAVALLRLTREHLRHPDGLWLRSFKNGTRSHRNWARGIAWYLLGHIQTLRHLPPELRPEFEEEARSAVAWIAQYQNAQGLWHTFVDEPGILPDTAGSAGIAAALALGFREGFLPEEALQQAHTAYAGLLNQLTPDGFLAGCSQSNKGGEELQRGDYRVISPYALGLMGILHAALYDPRTAAR